MGSTALPHNFLRLYNMWGPRFSPEVAPGRGRRAKLSDADAKFFAKRLSQGYQVAKEHHGYASVRALLARSKVCKEKWVKLNKPHPKTILAAIRRVCPTIKRRTQHVKWRLTKENKQERLQFCEKYAHISETALRRWLCVDEFSLEANAGRGFKVWSKAGYRLSPVTDMWQRSSKKGRVVLRVLIAVDHTGGVFITRCTGSSGFTPDRVFKV
jgi:hypothetical protein